MKEVDDLKLIKKYFGEKMMHLCRKLFPSILEIKGLLFNTIDSKFNRSKFLYDDIIENDMVAGFKNLIYSEVDVENNYKRVINKTPKELLNEVGYELYECKTEEDIKKFKKYYSNGEELCTFNGNRLNRCYVFFAVKKNVDNIKREKFKKPEREDLYGTSVISIQFTKDSSNTLSIKNRYNHTVNNPDSTFSNNLDNIIEGLTESFNKYYDLNINSNYHNNFELDHYVLASDKKYYKYNYEINNVYYCQNNVVIDNFKIKRYEKEKYIVFDFYILDLVNKKFIENNYVPQTAFVDSIGKIDKINIIKNKEEKQKEIKINDDIEIVLDSENRILKYQNDSVDKIGYNFLCYNRTIKSIILSNVIEIDNNFLGYNESLEYISLPRVETIGGFFLNENKNLRKINLPNVKNIDRNFLYSNEILSEISLPKVKNIDSDFLCYNLNLKSIVLTEVENIENNFLYHNVILNSISLPKVKIIGYDFLCHNKNLLSISLPEAEYIGEFFLFYNEILKIALFPKLENIGKNFIDKKKYFEYLYIPNLNK